MTNHETIMVFQLTQGMNKYDSFIAIKTAEGSMNAFRNKKSDE
ncbi:MAG TPA: hypothetical protein VNQ80_14700 [Parapedobacter sp.]|nr:hypothetical protein [Parapedobacter sp.]HWK58588.1 hypothetical protein [Parapedobacter sp.]